MNRWTPNPRRSGRIGAVATAAAALGLLGAQPVLAQHQLEAEPNNTIAEANPIGSNPAKITGEIWRTGNVDIDIYSFQATAGSRVYAATMTSFNYNLNTDSYVEVIGPDGVSVLEFDNDDGTHGPLASSLAGVPIPADGTYYLLVRHASVFGLIVNYDLYFHLQEGTPAAEVEPNDVGSPPQALPESGWILGETSSLTDEDYYWIPLNAGDTIVASLDLDPERDTVEWNGELGIGIIGGVVLTANDPGASGPDSESHLLTVTESGFYYVRVAVPAGGTTFGTYGLSVSVIPADACPSGNANTYTSTDVPVDIPNGPAIVSSTLTVPGNPRIGRLRVGINLTHDLMADLDVELRAPSGNVVALFNDIGTTTANPALVNMDVILDDDAGLPIGRYAIVEGMVSKPECLYRLGWFDGQYAGGEWTLTIRDDRAANGGVLNSWFLEICEEPLTTLVGCPDEAVVFSTDFEADDGGFTSSGVENEWRHGTPAFAPLDTAFSGVNAWVTDLTGTYNSLCNQELLSPQIDLTGATAPIYLRWAQEYQMQDAIFDSLFIDLLSLSGGPNRRLLDRTGPSMAAGVGSPAVLVHISAGWAMMEADISEYAGQVIQVRYKLTSDVNTEWAGLAIDDFSVVACANTPPPACPVDWDGSGAVNSTDISAFLAAWIGSVQAPDLVADFNGDGAVNSTDISAFLAAWIDAVVDGC